MGIKERAEGILERYENMYNGNLGTIKATENRIYCEKHGTDPPETIPSWTKVSRSIGGAYKNPTGHQFNRSLTYSVGSDGLTSAKEGSHNAILRVLPAPQRINYRETYPQPRMEVCIDSLGKENIFTTLDELWGQWKVSIAKQDRDKTKFTSHMVTYRYSRIPFVLSRYSATSQRALDIIISSVL